MFARIFFLVVLALSSAALSATPKIVWFSTLQQDLSDKSGFWKSLHDLMLATAEDLDIDFHVYYAEENFLKMHQQVNEVLSQEESRPDGILFHNYKNLAPTIFKQAERYGVKSFMFNSGLLMDADISLPRRRFKHWVGQMLPDDSYAGAELMRCLIDAEQSSRDRAIKDKLKVLAMEGNPSSKAYRQRKIGFESIVKNNQTLQFTQFFPADWSRKKAKSMFPTILNRYPSIKILWSANDNMALGLIDAAKNTNLILGKDIFIGGVDWLAESIESIQHGDMSCSIGGHFVEGMWSLILLYDFLNGYDFAEDRQSHRNPETINTKMAAITPRNVSGYRDLGDKLLPQNLSKIDFKRYSRSHNNADFKYNLSVSQFIEEMNELK